MWLVCQNRFNEKTHEIIRPKQETNKLPKVPINEPKLSNKNAVIRGISKTRLNMVIIKRVHKDSNLGPKG